MPGRARRPRHLRPVPRQEIPRYRVRLIVPRLGGWGQWGTVISDFEQRLAAQADPVVAGPRIDSQKRRGRDYVAVAIVMTINAPDVAQALTAAWDAFQRAAGADAAGWIWPVPRPRSSPRRPPGSFQRGTNV